MKLSLSWIKDYVNIPDDIDLRKLAYNLTMDTVEVEGMKNLADDYHNMVIGQIEDIISHPKAEKLKICRVNLGHLGLKQIVCGGTNLFSGMKVAVACPGAIVRWHGEGSPIAVNNAKLRGIESYGVICASNEIGLEELFPADDGVILDLSEFDACPGSELAKALDLNDFILEIDNKSMTNRPDLWGHYGIAREISALYNLPLLEFEKYEPDVDSLFEISVEDADRCPRYIGVQLKGVFVKPSPYKIQNRIWKVGMRPINALVDITNYVMLATGNPTHAFDCDHITDHITVRLAKEGESISLLNGKDIVLSGDDLVIADSMGPVALAGIMGGDKDSILSDTQNVILEVANFEATGVRRTALRYDNRTEASARYEKSIDPERCDQALSLAMHYFHSLYPEMKVMGFCDKYLKPLKCSEVDVDSTWLNRRLGKRIPTDVICKKLSLLGFSIELTDNNMHVVAPSWRSTGDISIKDDIMEEVARMYGYDNFESTAITTSFDKAINQLDKNLVRNIKEYLAFRCGVQEVYTYPWMEDQFVDALIPEKGNILKLSTPPAPNMRYIRSSLLPNLCEAIYKNQRYFSEFSIFEEAQVFADSDYSAPFDVTEKLPSQKKHIAAAFASNSKNILQLFREAKGILQYMPRYTHMTSFEFKNDLKPAWTDESLWLNVFLSEQKIGDFGLLSKRASLACGIKNLSVILFELDLTALEPYTSRTNKFCHLSEYPETDYDISMLFDDRTKWSQIIEVINNCKISEPLLKKAAFVDEYRGKQIPKGKKSITIRLTIGSGEKTLTTNEIEDCAQSIISELKQKLMAVLRIV